MENPSYWVKKIKNPNRILLTPKQIQMMNEENLRREELYLCDLKSLKEEMNKEEILNLFKEDLQGFGRTEEIRYGANGRILDDNFWNKLIENMNQDGLKDKNKILFGFITKRTDIRVFPTEEISIANPNAYEFDRFQHSSIPPGSLIAIYHLSRDNQWAYVQTIFIRGWIRKKDIAIAKEKLDIKNYLEEKQHVIVTGDQIKIFLDPFFKKEAFLASMGSSFPLIKLPEEKNKKYIIKIPIRTDDETLSFKKGYISSFEDVSIGFLPYTQKNIANQAFKLLNKPYSWGDKGGARDCSRFIMDIFSTFGIILPRNSKFQAQVGKSLGQFDSSNNIEEKKKVLDDALPLATILRLPGHVMLYLGKENKKYYVIHNLWGIQEKHKSGSQLIHKIGKVVVTDLNLGENSLQGSLLNRITDIRLIGER